MARDVIVVPIREAQDLPRWMHLECYTRGSAVAIVELDRRTPAAFRLCDNEQWAEGSAIGVAIGTFPQVLVFAKETDQQHFSTFLGHAKETKETLIKRR